MTEHLSYAGAGVDIDATDAAKSEMAKSIDCGDPRVLNRLGAFASLVEGRFEGLKHPILVYKTEEPGSKQKLAFELGRLPTIAYDLVNHLINDVMAMGAEPLYVQDCVVCGAFDAKLTTALVRELAAACREQGCVLVGGETSVQPGVVADGEPDYAVCPGCLVCGSQGYRQGDRARPARPVPLLPGDQGLGSGVSTQARSARGFLLH